jgi:hypothetical protein
VIVPSHHPPRRLLRLLVLLIVLFVLPLVLLRACGDGGRQTPPGQTPPGGTQSQVGRQDIPAPPWRGPIDSVSLAQVVAYARSLMYDTTRTAQDSVQLRSGSVVGPYAHIQEVAGTSGMPMAVVDSGRVVARVVRLTPGDFPPLGIRADTTYLWLDLVDDSARALWIPGDTTGSLGPEPVRRHYLRQGAAEHEAEAGIAGAKWTTVTENDSVHTTACYWTGSRHRSVPKVRL